MGDIFQTIVCIATGMTVIFTAISKLSDACEPIGRFFGKLGFGKRIEKILAPIQKQLGNIDARLDGIDERLDRIEETNAQQSEQINSLAVSQKNILRANIMDIYHAYRDVRIFPMSVKEQLDTLYKDYKKLKGNSYIDKYYTRMSCWQVLEDEPNP